MADTYTGNLGLTKPEPHTANWGLKLNADLDVIDGLGAIGPLGVQPTENPSTSLFVRVASGPYRKRDGTVVNYGGTTSVAVSASTSNFLYLTDAGVLTVNTTGFPAATDIVTLAVVSTDSVHVVSITDARRPFASFGQQSILYATGPANQVIATPDGAAGDPLLRALVGADIPSLDLITPPAGNVNWNGKKITSLADPTGAQDAATKNYVDLYIQGFSQKPTATVATAAALPANTYANGTAGAGATLTGTANGSLVVDGHAMVLGETVLVKNQAAPLQNGLYTVSQVGDVGHPYILTRSVAMDVSTEYVGALVPIGPAGSTNPGTLWLCGLTTAPVVGTTGITFSAIGTTASTLTISATAVSGGTSGNVLFNNAGVLGELTPANTHGMTLSTAGGQIKAARTPLQTTNTGAFDLLVSDLHIRTLDGTNGALSVTNETVNLPLTVILKQDGTGGRTVTWTGFGTIIWFGGVPTLSTGAGKYDVFTLVRIGAATWLGFTAGQNAS